MRLPLSWLKEFVTLPASPEALAERLTIAGLSVDKIERSALPETVVVGHVRDVQRHPSADRLRVATIDLGGRTATIVCGAPNLAVGQKVAVALPGTRLPNGMTIRATAIRGVSSAGMICAEDELGLGDDHTGIIVLPATARVGAPAATALGLGDVVLDLEVTPNRADCLSILGCAREVAALTNKKVRVPKSSHSTTGKLPAKELTVRVPAAKDCPFYSARVIDNVTVQPSPTWMQQRLVAAGVRPLNNIIDVTNYVMLELGQPLHAFDAAALSKNTIIVRRAAKGESLAALDGTTYQFTPEMLVIASSSGPVALAGIMGGERRNVHSGQGSGIVQTTTRVVLEAAVFNPILVRTTSKKLGLVSESSYRFERGVDRHATLTALDRAAALIAELAGGTVRPGRAVIGRRPTAPKPVTLDVDTTNTWLSLSLTPAAMTAIFKRLGATIRGRGRRPAQRDRRLTVVPPTWRRDLAIAEDLIEEVGRLVGYPKLPLTSLTGAIAPVEPPPLWRFKHDLTDALTGLGGSEMKNYPFREERHAVTLFPQTVKPVQLLNPLNRNQALLRTELLPGLLAKTGLAAREHSVLFLYEIGRCFAESDEALPAETERVAVVVLGTSPYRHLKGIVQTALEMVGIPTAAVRFTAGERGETLIVGATAVGHLTLLSPDLRSRFKIRGEAAGAELLLEPLAPLRAAPKAKPLPNFPPVRRDLAFWIPERLRYADVEKVLAKFDPLLVGSELFDVYDAPGRRSLALHLTFQSASRTLTSDEVDRVVKRLVATLATTLHAEQRTTAAENAKFKMQNSK